MPKIICKGVKNKGFKGADAVTITGMQIEKMPKYIDPDPRDDYDPCDACHERGDDYYQDEDGDWMMQCYDCPLWDMKIERRE